MKRKGARTGKEKKRRQVEGGGEGEGEEEEEGGEDTRETEPLRHGLFSLGTCTTTSSQQTRRKRKQPW